MHIAEGFLPPLHAAAWTLVAAPFVVHGAVSLARRLRERPEDRLLISAAGAFTFILSALKIPSVTGSTSHPTGTGLGAVLFRPPLMSVLGTIVLLFQALLLSHGGITTLGANACSMAIAGPWIGYAAWTLARRLGASLDVAVFLAAALADLATYCVTALQLALAFPAEQGGVLASLAKFASIFAVTQVPLAVIEGLLTVLVMRLVRQSAPADLAALGVLREREVAA